MSDRKRAARLEPRRFFAACGLVLVFVATASAPLAVAESPAAADAIERETQRGPVTARLRLRPAEPRIGDPIELELEVVAEAGVEVLMPEFGEALGRFQIVDFAPSQAVDAEGRSIARQRYTLAPTLSGAQRVPPLLVEFVDHRPGQDPAPADEDAYEVLTDALDFQVSSTLRDGEPLVLEPALGELGPLRDPLATTARWGGGAVVLAGIALAVLWLLRRLAQRVAQESPYAEAKRELAALGAEGPPDPERRDEVDAFFVRLSGIVRRYIERRFALNSPELTTEEFLAELQRSPDLLRAHQELLTELLGVADLVKFAQHTPDPSVIDHSLEIASRFVESTREADDAPSSLDDGDGPDTPEASRA